jgi:hypothetical protein
MNWHTLYLPITDSQGVAGALRSLLESQGYRPYDPFPGGTGTPPDLTDMVRQFVTPDQDGWVLVLGEPAAALLPDFSRAVNVPVLHGWLTDETGGFALYRKGMRYENAAAFESYLRPGSLPDDLRQAFAGNLRVPPVGSSGPAVVGGDALPTEIQQLAEDKQVDPKQANKLFEKISGSLFGRLGGGAASPEQDQARAVLMGAGRDRWNSLDGQRVRAIAGVLRLPDSWRAPDWDTVRDAYHVHRLRQRSPRMHMMPGDKEALKAVANALDYLPVYMGR